MLASANTGKVRQAFEKLEFYVYTGLFMEEAAYYADVILPVCSGLETEGVYMRRDDRAIRWQEAAVSRVGESKTDCEIWIELAHVMASASAVRLARMDEARAAVRRVRELDDALRCSTLRDWLALQRAEDLDHWTAALREAGLPE